ncbi:hypothetical protein PENTCL1PPCAC_19617, partial [Pristionchus entomophagus]
SVFSNGLLCFIMFTITSSNIGSYRYLLAAFAVCDMITSCVHLGLYPIMHMSSYGLYFFPRYGPIIILGHSCDNIFLLLFQ